MKMTWFSIFAPAAMALTLVFAGAGCEQDGPLEETGEEMQEAAEEGVDATEEAAEEAGDAAEEATD